MKRFWAMGADARTAIDKFRDNLKSGPRFVSRAAAADDTQNELLIYDVIGVDWFGGIGAKDVVNALRAMDDKKPVNVYINSPGGDVWEATAMYNALSRFKGQKNVFIDGIAASAASYIAMVGDEITTAFNAMWMIHNPWGIVIGNYLDLRKTADDLEKVTQTLRDTYVRRTEQKLDAVTKAMDDESWYTAQEALEFGLSDKITEEETKSSEEGAAAREGVVTSLLAKYKNTPAHLKPTVQQMVASMETRLKNNLPKRASPQRPAVPGQPGNRN